MKKKRSKKNVHIKTTTNNENDTPMTFKLDDGTTKISSIKESQKMRAIAYSMDLLLPGFYVWILGFSVRIGGSVPNDEPFKYPGTINSPIGIALVLPRYKIFTTYLGSYDPEQM